MKSVFAAVSLKTSLNKEHVRAQRDSLIDNSVLLEFVQQTPSLRKHHVHCPDCESVTATKKLKCRHDSLWGFMETLHTELQPCGQKKETKTCKSLTGVSLELHGFIRRWLEEVFDFSF